MTASNLSNVADAYAEQRERDWSAFVIGKGPLTDYWAAWEERSFGWKIPIEFLQPLGMDAPAVFEPLKPLLAELTELDEVHVPPIEWLHSTWVRVGFLRAVDILWSQVESFYVNASPRLHRIEPFSLRLAGLSVADDERIYVGIDDGGNYREARRQTRLGVPKVYEVMKEDPLITPEGDQFVPQLDIGYFTGRGDRKRVIDVLEKHRDIDLGELPLTLMKMARVPIQPHDHYVELDVIAEIPLMGANYRKGYHN
jgi:hypothetical protein